MNKNLLEINEFFKYKIHINYPTTNFNKINDKINFMINNIKEEFIASSKKNKKLKSYSTLHITYKKYIYKNITSYIFKIRQLTKKAYFNECTKSIIYDCHGNLIDINTLINNDNDILTKLSIFSRKILISKNEIKSDNIISIILDKTRINKNNFKNFALTKNGILIFFDCNHIDYCYLKSQKVLILYNKLL